VARLAQVIGAISGIDPTTRSEAMRGHVVTVWPDKMIGSQKDLEPFTAYVATRRVEIEAALDRVLPCPPMCPSLVAEAMRYGVVSRGKRIRPLLTLVSAEAVVRADDHCSDAALEEARSLAMPAACAVEFIHSYSLIHDDLPAMDNDSLRRGRPTVHILYGEALAILAGDGLLAEAFALLANEPDDSRPRIAERKLRVLKRVGQALGAGGMLGGQAMDLEFFGRLTGQPAGGVSDFDTTALQDMHARKTGSLMRAAACAGAIMAGGNAEQVAAIDRFAAELGLAFQIVDDILDVEGTSGVIGKTAGKDHQAGKPTYPAIFGLPQSRDLASACVERAQQALLECDLLDPRLMSIAQWAVQRSQ
jgi:geranylgeranyl pyrophosphate synthase